MAKVSYISVTNIGYEHFTFPLTTTRIIRFVLEVVFMCKDVAFIHKSEWVSDCCCLTSTKQFFSYIMARTSSFSMRWWWGLLCTRPTPFHWIFIMQTHWNNSLWVDMSPHSVTLSWYRANHSLLFLLNAMYLAEKQQIPIL
jgi:hypothetical protein